jgi:hypothetical protein
LTIDRRDYTVNIVYVIRMAADLPEVRQQRGFAMKRSLVVGVDGTDDSRNALARAAELARAAGLRLVVVHVRHIPVFAEMSSMTIGPARQDLDEIEVAARRAAEEVLQGTGVGWEFVVRSGDPEYGDELALPNGRYDLGLPPPFGPGAPPGTTFNVVVVPAS